MTDSPVYLASLRNIIIAEQMELNSMIGVCSIFRVATESQGLILKK